jgi:hypothetical protein
MRLLLAGVAADRGSAPAFPEGTESRQSYRFTRSIMWHVATIALLGVALFCV